MLSGVVGLAQMNTAALMRTISAAIFLPQPAAAQGSGLIRFPRFSGCKHHSMPKEHGPLHPVKKTFVARHHERVQLRNCRWY